MRRGELPYKSDRGIRTQPLALSMIQIYMLGASLLLNDNASKCTNGMEPKKEDICV